MTLPEFKQLVDEAKSQINEIGPNDLRRMQQSGEDFTLLDLPEREFCRSEAACYERHVVCDAPGMRTE